MKRITLAILAVAALGLVACNKNVQLGDNAGKYPVVLTLETRSGAISTRAAGDAVADTEAERTVGSYDVFAFRSDGSLDAYYGGTADQGTLSTNATGAFTTGEFYVSNETLDIYVIANGPADLKSSITTKTGLQNAVSLFTQNAASNFVMVGYKQQNILSLSADGNGVKHVTGMELERIVNKVTLGTVKKAFESAALQAAEVQLLGAYVVNATKQVNYLAKLGGADAVPTAADASYFNYDATWASNALITSTYGTAKTITAAGVDCSTSMYFYPNPAVESSSAAVDDYVTKLVLKVQIGSKVYYYPIGLPQVAANARNLIYEVSSVTLRRPGNDSEDPNKYIDASYIDVQLTVKDWVGAALTGSFYYDLLSDASEQVYSFGGLQIAPGPLFYNGSSYEIKDNWNYSSHGSVYGMNEGSTYFSFIEMGQLFEKAGFTTADDDIDNLIVPLSGWRLPTQSEWDAIIGITRDGSTVNGSAGKHFCLIQLTGVTYAGFSTPTGLLLFPDGETITGKALPTMDDDSDQTTGVTSAELAEYLAQGCVFLPASGSYFLGGWSDGGFRGNYWSSTENDELNGYDLCFVDNGVSANNYGSKSGSNYSVRLVKPVS